jgi:hypothetical protein
MEVNNTEISKNIKETIKRNEELLNLVEVKTTKLKESYYSKIYQMELLMESNEKKINDAI